MTEAQRQLVEIFILLADKGKPTWLSHGCCEGADIEAGEIAAGYGFKVRGWPGPGSHLDLPVDQLCAQRSHLERNRRIVDESDEVIAAPPTEDRQPRGGTWYTIDYAVKAGKKITIVYPSGRFEEITPTA